MISTADMVRDYELHRKIKRMEKGIMDIESESDRWKQLVKLEGLRIEHSKLKIKMFKYKIKQRNGEVI